MSQQPPNSQPPSPEPESQNSVTPSRRVTQPAQTQANSFQAVLKTQTIKFLRGTIRILEGAVTKLETPPLGTTQPSWWSAVLGKIRSLLPENLSSKFSDTALTGIIAGIAVILVWTTSSLFSGKPPEVATVPPTLENPPEVATAPSPTPETPEVATAPSPEPESTPTTPSLVEEPVPTPTIPTPAELTAPAEPEPVEETPLPAPEPTPTPVVELTPEQTLIAAIEDRVSEVSNGFADGLIQSIQANFEGSSLTVKIRSDWYKLKPSEQDNLAAQMLERSRELDFSRLEITDPQGTLLARSPVVGKDMIILNRVMGNG